MTEAEKWLAWLDGQRGRDPEDIEPFEGTAYQAAQRVAAELHELGAEVKQLKDEAAGRRRRIANLEKQLADARGESGIDQLAPHVHEIGAYWREKCSHPRAMIDGRRYRAVRARLVEGMRHGREIDQVKAEIREAIDGAAAAPNVNERTGEPYNDLELICRNQSKLDSFRARAPKTSTDELRNKLIGGTE